MHNIFRYFKYSKLNNNTKKFSSSKRQYISSYKKLWIDEIKNYCP